MINGSGLCPGFKTIILTNQVDEVDIPSRSSLAVLPDDTSEDEYAYNHMDFWLEVQTGEAADPFSETNDLEMEENNEDYARTRRELNSTAARVLSRQHRLHLFSIILCDHCARFMRWDRSGCLISERFDFHIHPELLGYFFWCYSKLSPMERGFDPTVQPATKAESRLLREAVAQYAQECDSRGRRNVTTLEESKGSEQPWTMYKVKVDFDGKSRALIIGRPFWDSGSPCGRATRGYLAYDMVEKRLVFLKDSWRTESTRILAEGMMYAKLKKRNVPFLPDVLAAVDIKLNNKIQKTVTQNYTNKPFPPPWLSPCSRLDTLIHYRVVQELAYPLASALSSKEAVQVIRDVVEGMSTHLFQYHYEQTCNIIFYM